MRCRPLLIIPLLVNIAACSRDTSHRVVHTELDGVQLIRTVGGPLHEGPIFELTSELVLGIDEGEPEWQIFGGIWSLFAPDGRMVLGDYRHSEIFIVSREGELLHRLGGSGAGPGEFRNLWLMHWIDPGREFWVEDQGLPYMNRFSMDGEFLGTIYDTHLRPKNIFIQPLGRDRFLASYGDRRGEESVTVSGFLDAALQWTEDFLTLRSQPSFQTTRNSYRPIPFTVGEGCSATPDGRILVTRPNEGRIALYSAKGGLLKYIEREWDFTPVTSQERQAIRKRLRESSSEEFQSMADRIPFPARYPAFMSAMMDDTGRIWVRHFPRGSYMRLEGPSTYDIFDADGVWLGTQQFEFGFSIAGDYAYRQYNAESGSPRIERFHIKPLVPEAVGRIQK